MEDGAFLECFYSNLDEAILSAGMTDHSLSGALGRGKNYIQDAKKAKRNPGLTTINRIAGILRCDIADLVRPPRMAPERRHIDDIRRGASQDGQRLAGYEGVPSMDDVLKWRASNGGRLEHFDQLAEYFELFDVPDRADVNPLPIFVGARSLASRELRLRGTDELLAVFQSSEGNLMQSVAAGHLRAATGEILLEHKSIGINITTGYRVMISYDRLLAPVTDSDGAVKILHYSLPRSLVRAAKRGDAEISDQPILCPVEG